MKNQFKWSIDPIVKAQTTTIIRSKRNFQFYLVNHIWCIMVFVSTIAKLGRVDFILVIAHSHSQLLPRYIYHTSHNYCIRRANSWTAQIHLPVFPNHFRTHPAPTNVPRLSLGTWDRAQHGRRYHSNRQNYTNKKQTNDFLFKCISNHEKW